MNGKKKGEDESEVAFFSAKRWDRRNRADLIESATPCHDTQVVGPYRDSDPLRLNVVASMSEDYTTAPQHLQYSKYSFVMNFKDGKSVQAHPIDNINFPSSTGISSDIGMLLEVYLLFCSPQC